MNIKNQIEEKRNEKDVFFMTHPQSPLSPEKRKEFDGLNYYPPNKKLIFELELHKHKNKKEIEVDDNKGNKRKYIRWGEFRFTVNEKKVKLQAYKNNPQEERLWVPFKDKTNGKETYGAGRYIDLETSKDKKNGKWVLDFNQAYNPFCAYSEKFVCPFIHPENWLKVEIKAGEKNYKGN